MNTAELKPVIEALLFVSDGPLTTDQIRETTESPTDTVREALDEIRNDCETTGRGWRLKEIAGGYQFITDPGLSEYVKTFIAKLEKRRLSNASLETLSIIAYKQPLTRAEIEFIRGVNVDQAVKTLLEKGLIKITGRKELPGRPMLYGTTKFFLDHFGLANLKELPRLAEFKETDIELPDSLKPTDTGPGETDPSDSPEEEAAFVQDAPDGASAGPELT